MKRILAGALFVCASYVALFGRVEPWLPVTLFLLIGSVVVLGHFARRNPAGLSARILFQSVGPQTSTAGASAAGPLRAGGAFLIAFLLFALLYALLMGLSETGASSQTRELALVLALVLVLPMTMSFAGGCYLLLRAAIRRFRERRRLT